MYICTDKTVVDTAYESAAPRDLDEMILEIYPDAVQDKNGRWHSPRDGYVCKLTDRVFRGGEYLPFSEEAVYPRRFIVKALFNGEVVEWECTVAQYSAVAKLLKEQSHALDAAVSEHVGKVGEKIELTLTVCAIRDFMGTYGPIFYNIMKTETGSIVVYKGAKILANRDETIRVSAKVKEHNVRDGVKSTRIERPKVL